MPKKKKVNKKKRNPQDATLRNVRAARARADEIRSALNKIHERLDELIEQIRNKEIIYIKDQNLLGF